MIKCNYVDPGLNELLATHLISTQEYALMSHIIADTVGAIDSLSKVAKFYLWKIIDEKISVQNS